MEVKEEAAVEPPMELEEETPVPTEAKALAVQQKGEELFESPTEDVPILVKSEASKFHIFLVLVLSLHILYITKYL